MSLSHRRSFLGLLSGAGLIGITGLPLVGRAADKIKPSSASALIVVDVQNCFVTGGTLPRRCTTLSDGTQVSPPVKLTTTSTPPSNLRRCGLEYLAYTHFTKSSFV